MIVLYIMMANLWVGGFQLIMSVIRMIFAKNKKYKRNLLKYWAVVGFYIIGLIATGSITTENAEQLQTIYLAFIPPLIALFYCWAVYQTYPKEN